MVAPTVVTRMTVRPLRCPLVVPFSIAVGTQQRVDNLLVSLELGDGTRGHGEAAVFTSITGETVAATRANLRRVAGELVGRDVADYLRVSGWLGELLGTNHCAQAAVEMAVLDALARQWGIPLWRMFGGRCRPLHTDMTIVLGTPEQAEREARLALRRGIRCFKIKVGGAVEADVERVRRVQRVVGRLPITLDANQGFSAAQSLDLVRRLRRAKVRVSLFEQPVRREDWDGLIEVTRESGVPVCADESVFTLADAVRLVKDRAAHAVNIKLAKHGVLAAREIAQVCQAAGVRLMIGGMVETALAMGCAAHLAAGLGGFEWVDLDTPLFMPANAMAGLRPSHAGVWDVRKVRAGLGVTPPAAR